MTITIELDQRTEAQIVALACEEGIDATAVVQRLVRDRFPAPDLHDGGNELGGRTFGEVFGDLIGVIDEGPDDVSTNPEKYMVGFGEDRAPRTPAK